MKYNDEWIDKMALLFRLNREIISVTFAEFLSEQNLKEERINKLRKEERLCTSISMAAKVKS